MKKKFLLGLGSLSIVATIGSIATVASCGSSQTDQEKSNNITPVMLLQALKIKADPTKNVGSVTEPTGDQLKNLTINEITGLNVEISNWVTHNGTGILTFDAKVLKNGIDDVNLSISLSGWLTPTAN
ncbi:MAG: hypothetical protein NC236_02420 [Mycoplasma sp.]|nr:hypothetical protein [Mycoplasma sp.]